MPRQASSWLDLITLQTESGIKPPSGVPQDGQATRLNGHIILRGQSQPNLTHPTIREATPLCHIKDMAPRVGQTVLVKHLWYASGLGNRETQRGGSHKCCKRPFRRWSHFECPIVNFTSIDEMSNMDERSPDGV